VPTGKSAAMRAMSRAKLIGRSTTSAVVVALRESRPVKARQQPQPPVGVAAVAVAGGGHVDQLVGRAGEEVVATLALGAGGGDEHGEGGHEGSFGCGGGKTAPPPSSWCGSSGAAGGEGRSGQGLHGWYAEFKRNFEQALGGRLARWTELRAKERDEAEERELAVLQWQPTSSGKEPATPRQWRHRGSRSTTRRTSR